jgi:hypothetical protein
MNGDWSKTSRVNDEETIREELFSIERLEQYAPMLANEHQVSERPRRGQGFWCKNYLTIQDIVEKESSEPL